MNDLEAETLAALLEAVGRPTIETRIRHFDGRTIAADVVYSYPPVDVDRLRAAIVDAVHARLEVCDPCPEPEAPGAVEAVWHEPFGDGDTTAPDEPYDEREPINDVTERLFYGDDERED